MWFLITYAANMPAPIGKMNAGAIRALTHWWSPCAPLLLFEPRTLMPCTNMLRPLILASNE